MEAMAPDEMDQDCRQKGGREELEDTVQDQIRAKEHEIRELKEEMKERREEIKQRREEIKEKEEEIRGVENEIRGVENEIAIASPTEVRELLNAKLPFLRQQIIFLRQEISSRHQQIMSLWQEISSCNQQIFSLQQEMGNVRSVQEAPAWAGLSAEVAEKLMQDLTDCLAGRKAKDKSKKSVRLSSVSQSIWDAIQQQERLTMKFTDLDLSQLLSCDLPAFGWDDRQERTQADRYIPHLRTIRTGRKWKLIDAANKHPTLLSGYFGGWNFKGTTDVAIVNRNVVSNPRNAIKSILKLKKDLGGGCQKAVIQTVVCLVMANLLAPHNRPFAVLTDLDDRWSSYWMDGSTINWCDFGSRAGAVGYIEELLQDSDDIEMGTSEALAMRASPHGESDRIPVVNKRRMYEPVGMDNLKDLVGLIPDEEIVSARVQLGVQELQSLLRTPLFSGAPDKDVDLAR